MTAGSIRIGFRAVESTGENIMIRDGEPFIESLERGDVAYRTANADRLRRQVDVLEKEMARLGELRRRALALLQRQSS